jgi:hypothetical protein
MQARPAYPVDAVTGGCFVTRRYEIAPGEMICDLDCDLEALPAWGRLCVSELGVRMMANCLGIEIPDGDILGDNILLAEENERLAAENAELRAAVAQVFDVAKFVNLAQVMADAS